MPPKRKQTAKSAPPGVPLPATMYRPMVPGFRPNVTFGQRLLPSVPALVAQRQFLNPMPGFGNNQQMAIPPYFNPASRLPPPPSQPTAGQAGHGDMAGQFMANAQLPQHYIGPGVAGPSTNAPTVNVTQNTMGHAENDSMANSVMTTNQPPQHNMGVGVSEPPMDASPMNARPRNVAQRTMEHPRNDSMAYSVMANNQPPHCSMDIGVAGPSMTAPSMNTPPTPRGHARNGSTANSVMANTTPQYVTGFAGPAHNVFAPASDPAASAMAGNYQSPYSYPVTGSPSNVSPSNMGHARNDSGSASLMPNTPQSQYPMGFGRNIQKTSPTKLLTQRQPRKGRRAASRIPTPPTPTNQTLRRGQGEISSDSSPSPPTKRARLSLTPPNGSPAKVYVKDGKMYLNPSGQTLMNLVDDASPTTVVTVPVPVGAALNATAPINAAPVNTAPFDPAQNVTASDDAPYLNFMFQDGEIELDFTDEEWAKGPPNVDGDSNPAWPEWTPPNQPQVNYMATPSENWPGHGMAGGGQIATLAGNAGNTTMSGLDAFFPELQNGNKSQQASIPEFDPFLQELDTEKQPDADLRGTSPETRSVTGEPSGKKIANSDGKPEEASMLDFNIFIQEMEADMERHGNSQATETVASWETETVNGVASGSNIAPMNGSALNGSPGESTITDPVTFLKEMENASQLQPRNAMAFLQSAFGLGIASSDLINTPSGGLGQASTSGLDAGAKKMETENYLQTNDSQASNMMAPQKINYGSNADLDIFFEGMEAENVASADTPADTPVDTPTDSPAECYTKINMFDDHNSLFGDDPAEYLGSTEAGTEWDDFDKEAESAFNEYEQVEADKM